MIKKNLFAAVVGRTNAGKSTLINLIVGDKIAIVSDKPQTTRTIIRGIITKNNTQFIFTDTPGLHKRTAKLSDHMLKATRGAVSELETSGEIIIMVSDVTRKISTPEKKLIESFSKGVPVILVLNKADLFKDKNKILDVIKEYKELYDFAEIIPISARNRSNTGNLLEILDKYSIELENNEYIFKEELSTDQSEKFYISELLREKLLWAVFEEIPHGIAVSVEDISDSETTKGKPIINIGFLVVCEKASHKGMIIGKQGSLLKMVGEQTRKELEEYFECKVNMQIWVKVIDDWRNKDRYIAEFGLSSSQN